MRGEGPREIFRGRFTPSYGQLALLDARASGYPQWDSGEKLAVFSPDGVAVAVEDADSAVEMVVYAGAGPGEAPDTSGEIRVGSAGLTVGNCIDGGTDLIDWPAGEATVDVYLDRRSSGEPHRVRLVLRGEARSNQDVAARPTELPAEERAALILERFARGDGARLHDTGNALARLGRPVGPRLLDALASPNASVRELAAYALMLLRGASAVHPLVTALGDGVPAVRRQAAAALGWLRDRRATEPLLAALRDRDTRVRSAAAGALGALRDPRAVDPLVDVLTNDREDRAVREEAARSLGKLKARRAIDPLLRELRRGDDDLRYAIGQAFLGLGAPAVPTVLELLQDKQPELRRWAARTLGHCRKQAPVEALAAALHDRDEGVRQAAADALGQLWNPRGAAPLMAALGDGSSGVRYYAAVSLGMVGDASALPALERMQRQDRGVTRWGAKVSEAAARSVASLRQRFGAGAPEEGGV